MSGDLTFNKYAAAILATALGFIGVREIAHAAYHPHQPDVPAYGADILAAAEAAAAAGSSQDAPLPFPQADWIAAMNFDAGKLVAAKCFACHSFEKGGATVTGPNLYGIVGAAAAQNATFKYSDAMRDAGIVWDFETLNAYLEKPSRYVKGTNMTFVGLKKPEQRAQMIEYMRTFADNPLPRPEPAPIPEEMDADAAIETVEMDDSQSMMPETEMPKTEMMPETEMHDATTNEAPAHE